MIRNIRISAPGQILRDLRDDHVRLIDQKPVADPEHQVLHNAYVMHAGSAYRRSLQLHRFEYRHRIDQSRTGRTPLDLQKPGFSLLICPFERKSIPRKFSRGPQRLPIRNTVIQSDKSVRRKAVLGHSSRKPVHRFVKRFSRYDPVFYRLKALAFQPEHFVFMRILKILSIGTDQTKRIKTHIPFSSDPVVQLPDRSAAKIPRILVSRVHIFDLFIDPLEVLVGDDGFAPEYKTAFKRDLNRKVPEHPRIVGDHLSDHTVSPCDCFREFSLFVGEYNGQPVHFPGQKGLMISDKGPQDLPVLGFIQRKHRCLMLFFRQTVHRLISDFSGGAVRKDDPAGLFQILQFVIQTVIFQIAHDLPVFLVICLRRCQQPVRQFLHTFDRTLIHPFPQLLSHGRASAAAPHTLRLSPLCIFRQEVPPDAGS